MISFGDAIQLFLTMQALIITNQQYHDAAIEAFKTKTSPASQERKNEKKNLQMLK